MRAAPASTWGSLVTRKTNHNYSPRKDVQCPAGKTNEERGQNLARLTTSPELAACRVIESAEAYSGLGDQLGVPALMQELRDQANGWTPERRAKQAELIRKWKP